MRRALTVSLGLGLAVAMTLLPAHPAVAQPAPSEVAALNLLNAERARAGLAPLPLDPALSAVAAAHARDMVDGGYFAHVSPRTGTPAARVRRAGITFEAVGENLARHRSAAEAHGLIMGSAPHRATLLSDRFGAVGIGAAVDRWGWVTIVQVFVRPPEPGEPGAHYAGRSTAPAATVPATTVAATAGATDGR